jgi:hypothetical protein
MAHLRTPGAMSVGIVSAIVGTAVGGLSTGLSSLARPMQVGSFRVIAAPSDEAARAITESTAFDFGTLGANETGSHRFTVVNGGRSPLSLAEGASSCSCTIGGLDREEIPPGESAIVTIDWKTKGQGGPFRQRVTVLTNDPLRPEISFEVSGTVVPKWRIDPDEVILDRLSASGSSSATVRLLTYGETRLNLERLSVETAGAAGDGSTTDPVSATSRPLSEEELRQDSPASGGFAIHVQAGPGLPVGPMRRTVRLELSVADSTEQGRDPVTLDIPVRGSVTGNVGIAGNGWDTANEMVALGHVSSATGASVDLFLTVKGPDRERVMPVVRERIPQSLVVDVGTPSPIGAGTVWKVPIQIRVPTGSRTCNHLGSRQGPLGRVVLETGLPDTPEMTLPVRVAIGP